MRRSFALLITLGALTTAAPTAGATTLVDGVAATRAGAQLALTFTPAALTGAKLRAGDEIEADCDVQPPEQDLALADGDDDDASGVYGVGIVGADGAAHITLATGDVNAQGPLPDVDVCHVLRKDPSAADKNVSVTTEVAQVGLTPRGTTWVDESRRAVAMHELLVRARGAHGYRSAAELGSGVVALDGPDGALATGQTGYWTDGTRATVAAVSTAGRRLVLQDLGRGMLRTNVMDKADLFGEALTDVLTASEIPGSAAPGGKSPDDDGSRSPYRGTDPLMSADGVRAARNGRRVTMRFTGRSAKTLRALAGRKVTIFCLNRPAPAGVFPRLQVAKGDYAGGGWTRVPRHGGRVTVTLAGGSGGDLCAVIDDETMVALAGATTAGRAWWQDLDAVMTLFAADKLDFGAAGAHAYPSAADVARPQKGAVAMKGPNGPVPVGRIGVWTDGARHAVMSTRSGSGRVFTLADEGDHMTRTNTFSELSWFWLALSLGSSSGSSGTL